MINRTNLNNSLRVILDQWNQEIDGLEKYIHKFEGETRKEYGRKVGELKDQKSALKHKMGSIEKASEKKLEEIEAGLESAKKAFKATMEKAKNFID